MSQHKGKAPAAHAPEAFESSQVNDSSDSGSKRAENGKIAGKSGLGHGGTPSPEVCNSFSSCEELPEVLSHEYHPHPSPALPTADENPSARGDDPSDEQLSELLDPRQVEEFERQAEKRENANKFDVSHISERAAEYLSEKWRYAKEGDWLKWNGRYWEKASHAEITETVRLWLKTEAKRVVNEAEDIRNVGKIVSKLLNRTTARDVVDFVKGQILVSLADFDQDPDIAVALNGVINLSSGELLPHSSKRLVTQHIEIDYKPDARHEDWSSALTALDDRAVARYLQVRCGQMLTGYPTSDDKMLVFQGGGSNGKSAVLTAIMNAFGSYSVAVPDKMLAGDSRSHSTELMVLRGSRMAVQEETAEGHHLDIKTLKRILGTHEVTARYVHRDNITFKSTWGVVLTSNYRLSVSEIDNGTWRRLEEIPFPLTYVDPATRPNGALAPHERARDNGLRDRLIEGKAQREAVLAWLVRGAVAWYEHDRTLPPPPERVARGTSEWRASNDLLAGFAQENLTITNSQSDVVWQTELLKEFNNYLSANGLSPWSVKTFRSRVELSLVQEHGIEVKERVRSRTIKSLSRPRSNTGYQIDYPVAERGTFLFGLRFVR